ncbi:hypothetical protein BGX24_003717, partial [Mortierella sp. AD032]
LAVEALKTVDYNQTILKTEYDRPYDHDLYCESSSYLLYLKALYTPYSLDHMNLHRLMHLIASPRHRYGLHVSISRIWHCRNLRTLSRLLPLRTRQGIDRPAPLPEHSRITFGYIVRVCPKLREIKMSNDDSSTGIPYLDMAILVGLCLLG